MAVDSGVPEPLDQERIRHEAPSVQHPEPGPDERHGPARNDRGQDAPPDPKRWAALVVLLVAAFMDMLDVTIVNVAIPEIQATLGASYAAIQWVTAGYALAFALLLITGGRLGDIFGRKRVFVLGMTGFTVASLLCGIAAEPWQLAASRVLQGAMAAVMIPQILAIIHVTFPRGERGTAFGMYGAIAGLAAVLGMVLGGVLTQWDLFGLGWRPVFLLNVPIGIVGLVIGLRVIRESKGPREVRLDLPGVALLTVGLLMLLFPLLQGRELHWPVWGFVSMAASLPVLALFAAYQRGKTRKDGYPLVSLPLFRVRSFTSGLGIYLLFNLAMGIFFLSWAMYMQLGLGWSPMRAGLSGVPFCLGAAPGAALSVAVLSPRFGRRVPQAGALLMLAGIGSYVWATDQFGSGLGFWHQLVPLLVLGAGFGMVSAPLADIALTDVPAKDAGSGSGLLNATLQLGSAFGIALTSVVFFGVLGPQAGKGAEEAVPQLRQDLVAAGVAQERTGDIVRAFVRCSESRAESSGHAGGQALCGAEAAPEDSPRVTAALERAGAESTALTFGGAFRIALWSIVGVMALALVLMPTLPRRTLVRDPDAEDAVPVH